MGCPQRMLRAADKRTAGRRDADDARLYGLSRDDLRRVLDPHDVYGSDFPWGGKTFRVLTKSPSFAWRAPGTMCRTGRGGRRKS